MVRKGDRSPRGVDANYPRQLPKRNPSTASKNRNDVKSPLAGVCPSRCGRSCSAQESGEAWRTQTVEIAVKQLSRYGRVWQSRCGAGEAGSIVGGWRAEVESASSRGEKQSFSFHCSTTSGGRFCRVESNAGCHQRFTTGIGQVAASSTSGSHDYDVSCVGPRSQSASVKS